MQQSDYEIVGKFGFESRTHRSLKEKTIKESLDFQRNRGFLLFHPME